MLRKLPISFHYCKNNEKLFLLSFYYASTAPLLRLYCASTAPLLSRTTRIRYTRLRIPYASTRLIFANIGGKIIIGRSKLRRAILTHPLASGSLTH